jgi:hypothetical protein
LWCQSPLLQRVSKCKQIGIRISNDQELEKTKNQISLFLWDLLHLLVGQREREREHPFERERVRNFDRHYYCLQVSVTFGVANSILISDSVVYMWWNVAVPVTAQVLKFAGQGIQTYRRLQEYLRI